MAELPVQLIRPPYKTDSICPPINLMALAGHVEQWHPVTITDFVPPYIRDEMTLDGSGIRQAAERVLSLATPVLGFTSMCSSYAATLRIAQECKRLDPSRSIVLGGPHASFVAGETLAAFDFVDAVIVGEGEMPLVACLDALAGGRSLAGIPGLVCRHADEIVAAPPEAVLDDLDLLPMPAFHLIPDPDRYFGTDVERFIEIEVGRGCPFACTFCSTSLFFSRKYRMKSPQRVAAEMRWLRENWNVASFGLIHDNLTSNKKKVRRFCDHLQETGERFRWHCSSRTDTIDRPLMEAMRDAGCRSIFFGVETGSAEMQQQMGKRLKLDRTRQTLADLTNVGIDATVSFIIGFPEETIAMLEETLQMALDLRLQGIRDVQLHPLSALPGTQVLEAHEDRLVFYRHLLSFQDITSVIDITDTEAAWIAAHRRIFSNFYAVPPLHYPLDLVHRVRGTYFYLVHFRPLTLECLRRTMGWTHVGIVERLCEILPAEFAAWQPDVLLDALDRVIAGLGYARRLVEDVRAYEAMIDSLSHYSDGANGWLHYKGTGPVPCEPGPRLRPARVAMLRYDVSAAIAALRDDGFNLPPERCNSLAAVFEEDDWRIRTMEVDDITRRIIDGVAQGSSLTAALCEVSTSLGEIMPEKGDWTQDLLSHLDAAGLLLDDVRPA